MNIAVRVKRPGDLFKLSIQFEVMGGVIGPADRTCHPGGIPGGFVVTAPGDDAGMIVEKGQHGVHLAGGLFPKIGFVRIAPLQWEILPDQHSGPITNLVEFGRKDMRMHAQHIQVGLPGQSYIPDKKIGSRAAAKGMLAGDRNFREKRFG